MEINHEDIQLMAYRLIRRETQRFDRDLNDERSLGFYVKGVVELQTELYKVDENNKDCK